MKKMFHWAAALLLLSPHTSPLSTAFAQGTAFTYQGRLNSNDAPANGSYDLAFSLYATNSGGIAVAGPVTNAAVGVALTAVQGLNENVDGLTQAEQVQIASLKTENADLKQQLDVLKQFVNQLNQKLNGGAQ
jgi:outer membrane murein-binding lipoprotein Lpp